MRVPQVSDRIKEAPAQALRGVFAGIGQLLLITDKLRNKTPAGQHVPRARAPEPPETRADPAPQDPPPEPVPSATPVLPTTSDPSAPRVAKTTPAPPVPPTPRVAKTTSAPPVPPTPRVAEARDFDKTGNVRLITSEKAAAGEPLPNYDEMSIASLRARLRNLDLTQLQQLASYEKAHAARADVLTMFERRIAKLKDEASAETDAQAEIEARDNVAGEVQEEIEAEAGGEV